ncbi:MAG: YlbF family regulator [Deltaproteobacteria bacterium]
MSVYDKSHELARAIRESEENREFKKIRNLVYSNEKNKGLISDFKLKQFEIQAEQLTGKEPDKEKLEQLQSLYGILTANPEIAKYFEAEYKFERLISDVYKILGETIDIDNDLIK